MASSGHAPYKLLMIRLILARCPPSLVHYLNWAITVAMSIWNSKVSQTCHTIEIYSIELLLSNSTLLRTEAFQCFSTNARKIGKAWLIWRCTCNRMWFEASVAYFHPLTHAMSVVMIHHVTNSVGEWVEIQLCLKLCPIISPDRPGLPNFSRVCWKTWEGLGMRLF